MKQLSTTVKTGDTINYNGKTCVIGIYKNKLVEFRTMLSSTSAITEWISTRELNKRLATNN
jgi:uncharacterized protein (DUF2342 family)